MLYELRCTLFFATLDPIKDIRDKINDHWGDAQVINPDLPSREDSIVELLENHHDEDPTSPCTLLKMVST